MKILKQIFFIVIGVVVFAICRYIWLLLGVLIFGLGASSVGSTDIHNYIEKVYLVFISVIAINLAMLIAKQKYKDTWPSILLILIVIYCFTFEQKIPY